MNRRDELLRKLKDPNYHMTKAESDELGPVTNSDLAPISGDTFVDNLLIKQGAKKGYYDSKGNEVEITETGGGYEEAHVVSATYISDTLPEEVPDSELDYLSRTYFEQISDDEFQKSVMAAEYELEGDR
jgi:hypothetical protein